MNKFHCISILCLISYLFSCGYLQASQQGKGGNGGLLEKVVQKPQGDVPEIVIQEEPCSADTSIQNLKNLYQDGFIKSWVRSSATGVLGEKAGNFVTDYGQDVAVYGGLSMLFLSQIKRVPVVKFKSPLYGAGKGLKRFFTKISCVTFGYLYYTSASLKQEMIRRFIMAEQDRQRIADEAGEHRTTIADEAKKERAAISQTLCNVSEKVGDVDQKLTTLQEVVKLGFDGQDEKAKELLSQLDKLTSRQKKILSAIQEVGKMVNVNTKIGATGKKSPQIKDLIDKANQALNKIGAMEQLD